MKMTLEIKQSFHTCKWCNSKALFICKPKCLAWKKQAENSGLEFWAKILGQARIPDQKFHMFAIFYSFLHNELDKIINK